MKPFPQCSDIKELLKLCDIYLDAYPYGGATSIIDPLQTGLLAVVVQGEYLRFRQASALLRELGVPELIAADEAGYRELAVSLGRRHELRQQQRAKIMEKMQAPAVPGRQTLLRVGQHAPGGFVYQALQVRIRMDNNYPVSCYDEYLSLKMSGTMWLIFLFLLRPIVVMLLSLVNRSGPMQLINMVYPDRLVLSLGAFAAIPTAILVYAWAKKAPGASAFVRYVWQKGRIVLIVSTVLGIGVIFAPLVLGTADKITASSWAQLSISMLIIFVVFRSRYIKDCFADFPGEKN